MLLFLVELSGLQFSQLELGVYEDQVTDTFVLTYDNARSVFLNSQQWLSQAKEFYSLDFHASDYIRIVQDHSELYRNLVFFEDDEERWVCFNLVSGTSSRTWCSKDYPLRPVIASEGILSCIYKYCTVKSRLIIICLVGNNEKIVTSKY